MQKRTGIPTPNPLPRGEGAILGKPLPRRGRGWGGVSGFTLIELLTVIAIIAILTAILFPVFAQVRENARASTSLSNMKQISTALAQFQLDNRKYPDVLLGYVYHQNGDPTKPVVAMDKALAQAQSDYDALVANKVTDPTQLATVNPATYFPGLYPEYIKDVNVFTDPNNQVTDRTKDTATANGGKYTPVNILAPCSAATDTVLNNFGSSPCSGFGGGAAASTGTLLATARDFYIADAYDVSPLITGNNSIKDGATGVYVPRYQSSWTSVDNHSTNPSGPFLDCGQNAPGANPFGLCNTGGTGLPQRNDYLHQGRWKAPPSDTYLDSTTYHVPQNSFVLVLREDGSAKKVTVTKFQSSGDGGATDADVSDISVNSNGVSQANFWKSPEN